MRKVIRKVIERKSIIINLETLSVQKMSKSFCTPLNHARYIDAI